jgi:hypothetical protein
LLKSYSLFIVITLAALAALVLLALGRTGFAGRDHAHERFFVAEFLERVAYDEERAVLVEPERQPAFFSLAVLLWSSYTNTRASRSW